MSIAFNKVKTELYLDDVLPFGRHQGYTVGEILKDRPEYIAWLIQNTSLKFNHSIHAVLEILALEINSAYKPRRRMYNYNRKDWSPDDYEQDLIFGDWDTDAPF